MIHYNFLVAAAVLGATPALAHSEAHVPLGFVAGFLHPLGGPDHMLAMLAVGLFAASLGGRALWAVPASFLLMMLMGSAIGYAGIAIWSSELWLAASVIALGAIVASDRPWPVGGAMVVVGIFALIHGYAYGFEMPRNVGVMSYNLGFILASGVAHVVAVMTRIGLIGGVAGRSAGAAIAFTGVVLIVG